MDSFLSLAQNRYSCRRYSDQPIPREVLETCVEAARLAPSACNSQPWRFVVVQSEDVLPKIAEATQQMGINGFTSNAKAFIIVLEEHARLMASLRKALDSQYFAKHDLGAATHSLCLAAADQGLGSCILGLFDRETICKALDLPLEQRITAVVALGYPKEEKHPAKKRKPLDEVVRFV